jgi:hypothetical protein
MSISIRLLTTFTVALAILAAITGAGAAPLPPTSTPPAYTITVIGPFSQQGRFGLGLNNTGHVTGQTTGRQAFLYDDALHPLGKPAGATFSVGQDIADNDTIAATAQQGTIRHAYAVTYSRGHVTWTGLAGRPGYQESQADAILPDGSAIVGSLCATGDPACSHRGETGLGVVWRRSAGKWSAPMVLPTGAARGVVSGIARAGGLTVVSGDIIPRTGNIAGQAVLWLLPAHRFFPLTGTDGYSVTSTGPIAHGRGNTFYVAGTLARPNGSGTYGEPVRWTVTCTATACRQTRLQVITAIGEVFAVSGHGLVTGYDRSGGDAGWNFIWHNGKEIPFDLAGFAINDAGQMVTWRSAPHQTQAILLTPAEHS